jgi:hypothetical protein
VVGPEEIPSLDTLADKFQRIFRELSYTAHQWS